MTKIINQVGSGKTKEIMLKASMDRATLLCKDPEPMMYKAMDYDILVNIRGYDSWNDTKGPLYIDDLDEFLNYLNSNIKGFNLNVEGENKC